MNNNNINSTKTSRLEQGWSKIADKTEQGRAAARSRLNTAGDTDPLTGRITSENYVKYPLAGERTANGGGGGGPQVTFDLGGGPKKTKMTELASVKRPITIDRPGSALPSDARARLQELAGGGDIKRNYRKSSDPAPRPNRLNVTGVINGGVTGKYVVSPPTTPTRTTSPAAAGGGGGAGENNVHLKSRTSLTRKDSKTLNSAKNSLIISYQNNNVKNSKNGGNSPGSRGGSGVGGGNRTRTPSVERSLRSLNTKDDPASKVRGKSFWGGWWKF